MEKALVGAFSERCETSRRSVDSSNPRLGRDGGLGQQEGLGHGGRPRPRQPRGHRGRGHARARVGL